MKVYLFLMRVLARGFFAGFYLGGVAAVFLLAFSPAAMAQATDLDLSAQVSSPEVEVGEPFTIELKALSTNQSESPSDPELRAPGSFRVIGPSVGTQSFMQIGPGGMVSKMGISATWQLTASSPGSFTLNGPTVVWKGRRVKANRLTVEVVPAGTRPKRPSNPFLRPGGPGGIFNTIPWPFGGIEGPAEEEDDDPNAAKNELAMPKAPDKNLFLRAVADKESAVIGEQINLLFYVYYRVDFEMTERREAPLSDFVRMSLLKNPGTDPAVIAVVEGRRYAVRLLDKVAIFPVRAGELQTGSMSARFSGRKVGARVLRSSNNVVIRVSEPPAQGRPPGYALGNVGLFSLSATVEPRQIAEGGSVAVTLKLSGTGNFPQTLKLPERTALSWSDPEKRESIEPENGKISGFRSFGHVVRISEVGTVNLGRVELPYWDPVAKRYEVARADLGTVTVTPAQGSAVDAPKNAPDAEQQKRDPLAKLGPARPSLGAYAKASPPFLAGDGFWFGLLSPPLALGLFTAGSRAARALRKRRAALKASPKTLGEQALVEAQKARAAGNAKETAAAVERAVYAALEHATGLLARGVLLSDLEAELRTRGLSSEEAEKAAELLKQCETLRFDPAASKEALSELSSRAGTVLRALLERKAA